jgi:hypothetical protein
MSARAIQHNGSEVGALGSFTCIECGQSFRVGERVEHIPGSTTRHVECSDEYERSEPF